MLSKQLFRNHSHGFGLAMMNTKLHESSCRKTNHECPKTDDTETRRKDEDKMAIIFLVIISSFMFCHLPRVAMDVHEIATLADSTFCAEHKMRNPFPAWSFIIIYISNFCLVINATMNMFIYCFMSVSFRQEVCEVLENFKCRFK